MPTFDEFLVQEWEKALDGCDYGETNWRQYSLAWFKQGFDVGARVGQKQGQESGDLKWRKELASTHSVGYRGGLSYAAFQTSHMSIDESELLGLTAPQAAVLMREKIVTMLIAAEKAEQVRALAKVEPILNKPAPPSDRFLKEGEIQKPESYE